MPEEEVYITGTLIWYYYICQRQVWLMGRHITPDEDHPSIDLGRFIHDFAYERDRKELSIGHMKLDLVKLKGGQIVVGEIKKSSRFEKSAKMQLLFYIDELRRLGIDAEGELRFPQEKRREKVSLDAVAISELEHARAEILKILYQTSPPPPKKTSFCKPCGYAEFCWS
ncbi:MAG TPA: CRISPR-associated protein Cas4 [Firmicutes bacterium]|nr:CRISPR-associated protein Cas4 [Bacillota bacterium]HHY99029.1 CRISPR-associated protein Cas4 [Bacillota bacterium]